MPPSNRHMVDFIKSKRTKHSWLSPIVVACCKSNDGTTKARRYRFLEQSNERKTYPLPDTKENPIVQVDTGRNYYPTRVKYFLFALLFSKNHEKVLPGTSLFHPEASVKQAKSSETHPPLPVVWNGLSGVSCFHCWRVIPHLHVYLEGNARQPPW